MRYLEYGVEASLRTPTMYIVVACALLAAPGCEMINYSPHQANFDEDETDINRRSIERLQNEPAPDGPIKIALVTDTQNYFTESDDCVSDINARDDISFTIHMGDITAFGITREYEWMHDIFQDLDRPYMALVGNHDLRANGGDLYRTVYGKMDFSFVWARTKYIFHDNNARQYDFDGSVPDLDWLAAQLEPSEDWDRAVVLGHVPPDHPDFDAELRDDYTKLLEQNDAVVASLHGHAHRLRADRSGGVLYLVGVGVGKRAYTVLTLDEDSVSYERVNY